VNPAKVTDGDVIMERDYFMTAPEAQEYGLIDRVLSRRFESDARPAV
jgi:ATP-dependent protease ClpP protease subunit